MDETEREFIGTSNEAPGLRRLISSGAINALPMTEPEFFDAMEAAWRSSRRPNDCDYPRRCFCTACHTEHA